MAKLNRNRNPNRKPADSSRGKDDNAPVTLLQYLKYGLLCTIPILLISLIIGLVPFSSSDDEEQYQAPTSSLNDNSYLHDDAVVLFPRIMGHANRLLDTLREKSDIRFQIVTTPAIPDGIDAYASLAMRIWNVPADSKAALLVYAPAHHRHTLLFSPALAAAVDTTDARKAVADGIADWPNDPNGAVLTAVESLIQRLDPQHAGASHSWDPNATDSAEFRAALSRRPAPLKLVDPTKPVPPTDAPPSEASPGYAILFFLVAPMMLWTCWKVVVDSSFNWVLLPVCVTIVYGQFSTPLAIVTGCIAMVSLFSAMVVLKGNSDA